MPAKIWDSTNNAFKDAENPKIFVNGVATDSVGMLYDTTQQAFTKEVWSATPTLYLDSSVTKTSTSPSYCSVTDEGNGVYKLSAQRVSGTPYQTSIVIDNTAHKINHIEFDKIQLYASANDPGLGNPSLNLEIDVSNTRPNNSATRFPKNSGTNFQYPASDPQVWANFPDLSVYMPSTFIVDGVSSYSYIAITFSVGGGYNPNMSGWARIGNLKFS